MVKDQREYIGDGVFVFFDGWGWWLETDRERSDGRLDRIYLEPDVAVKMLHLMGIK